MTDRKLRQLYKMDNTPSPEPSDKASAIPQAEVLKPREDGNNLAGDAAEATKTVEATKPQRRRAYRPSHRATFIGLSVVVLILSVNAGIAFFILKKSKSNDKSATGQVTISAADLSKIGVNSSSIGNSGIELVVEPNAKFNSKLSVAGDVSISGQFKLNSKLTASEASITKLDAGTTSLDQLSVNGNTTLTNLNLRSGFVVTGTTQLQGPVTIGQLLTVNNNLTVLGNLAVGGILSTATFSANSLTSTSTLTIGGHIITSLGSSPGVTAGSALGSNGTVSINGSDSAGRIGVNIGVGAATSGTLANVTFHNSFATTPRVVISFVVIVPAGAVPICSFYIFSLTTSGFSVMDNCSSTLPTGGYAVDYIVFQ